MADTPWTVSASTGGPWHPLASRLVAAAALALVVLGTSCDKSSTPPCPTCPTPPPPVGSGATLVGAGDIADCTPGVSAGLVATARMLDDIPGTVFAAGDNAYENGTADEYRTCYDPYWGRHKARTLPVPGNHEYNTPGATGYYGYFSAFTGVGGNGYYRRTVGSWTFLGLNSEIDVSANSAQVQWLKAELNANPTKCTVAMWHRPRFSSGTHGRPDQTADLRALWQAAYDLNVDIVINGHEHLYERFDPQDANGNPDPRGPQQFTVGTGGGGLTAPERVERNSQSRISYWGLAVFNLRDNDYSWEFRPIDSSGPTDFGSASCH